MYIRAVKFFSALTGLLILSACGSEDSNVSGLNPVAAPTPAIAIDFAAAASNAAEANTNRTVTVNLSQVAPAGGITVDYAITGTATEGAGNDFILANGTLTFAAGDNTEDITIDVEADNIYEANETVIITLSNATGDGAGLGTTTVHTHTINNDDAAPTVAFAAATSNALENAAHTVNVSLTGNASEVPITVDYADAGTGSATSGTDYTAGSVAGTLTFVAGDTSETITISVTDGSVYEGNETIDLELSNPTVATLGAQDSHTHTITENDAAPTVAFSAATSSVSEATAARTIAVTLSGNASDVAITVEYSDAGTGSATSVTDYAALATPGTLTFAPGDTSENIAISAVTETMFELDETIALVLANPTVATLGGQTTHVHTIANDDTAPTVQFSAATSSASEAAANNMAVTLSNASYQAVTVDYAVTSGTAVGGGSDYTLDGTGTLTFNSGSTSENISLTMNNDGNFEGSETVSLSISNPGNATLGAQTSHVHTITDDEATPNFTWIGTTNSNWNTNTNWQGGVVPGAGDTVRFANGVCTNCNPTINAAANALSVNLLAGYTGTITQGAFTLTIAQDYSMANGTFNGSASALSIGRDMTQTGGTFTAGAQTITLGRTWAYSAGTLSLSNATLSLGNGVNNISVNVGSNPVKNIDLYPWVSNTISFAATTKVTNHLGFNCENGDGWDSNIFDSGTIELSGNMTEYSTSFLACFGLTGTGTIKFVGGGTHNVLSPGWGIGFTNIEILNGSSVSWDSQLTQFNNLTLTSGSFTVYAGSSTDIQVNLSTAAGTVINKNGGDVNINGTHSPALGTINP